MKRKIIAYLKSKEENQYNNLDIIFKKYVNGDLDDLLKKRGFSKIEIFSQIRNTANYLQMNFAYFNLVINVEFDDFNFDYCIYLPGISADDFEKCIEQNEYEKDFSIETFICRLYDELNEDERLDQNVCEDVTMLRRKKFKFLKWIAVLMPILICSILGLYVFIRKTPLYLGAWFPVIMGIFIVVYIIFDFLSEK